MFTNSVCCIQVHRAFYWVEYELGWENVLVFAVVELYRKRRAGHLRHHFQSFGHSFPDVMVDSSRECLEIILEAAHLREAEGLCYILTPLYCYIRPSDRILHILC